MDRQDHIEERPDVMNGKPVFRGTRITVEHVLQELATGMAEDELLRGHPCLTRDHMRAARAYAAVAREKQHLLHVAERLAQSDDPAEQERLKDDLARLTFGG